jgi:hypothetical protein
MNCGHLISAKISAENEYYVITARQSCQLEAQMRVTSRRLNCFRDRRPANAEPGRNCFRVADGVCQLTTSIN